MRRNFGRPSKSTGRTCGTNATGRLDLALVALSYIVQRRGEAVVFPLIKDLVERVLLNLPCHHSVHGASSDQDSQRVCCRRSTAPGRVLAFFVLRQVRIGIRGDSTVLLGRLLGFGSRHGGKQRGTAGRFDNESDSERSAFVLFQTDVQYKFYVEFYVASAKPHWGDPQRQDTQRFIVRNT